MTAAQTKEHEEDKTCRDKGGEKRRVPGRKQGTKARNRTQGVHTNINAICILVYRRGNTYIYIYISGTKF